MNRRVAVGLTLIGLLLACFARLAADPSALLVDADHPSVDHAGPGFAPAPGNDLTRLFLPHHLGIARQVARTGHPPLWDDRGFGGRPMVGNPQASLFYPPAWIAWAAGWPSALGWITLGHLCWMGLGTYRLARTTGLSEAGSLVAAGCVQISPYVLAQTFEGHYPHVWAASWYPWAFEATIRLRRAFDSLSRKESGPGGAVARLALILAACFLTGHPQEGYYLLIALGLWVASDGLMAIGTGREPASGKAISGILCLPLPPGEGRGEEHSDRPAMPDNLHSALGGEAMGPHPNPLPGGEGVGKGSLNKLSSTLGYWSAWVGVLILATGLLAVELIPDAMAQSWALRGARLPIHLAGQYHLEAVNALQLLGPRVLGGPADYFGHENYWESVLSIGLVPLFLAIVGLAWSVNRRVVRGWLILTVGAILFASGRKLGLFAVLYQVLPGMDRFRVPARSLFLASLGLSMLAGLGVDALRARSGDGTRWRKLARRWSIAALVIGLMVLAGRFVSGRIDTTFAQPEAKVGRVPELHRWLVGLARLSKDSLFWGALGTSTLAVIWAAWSPKDRRKAALILGALGLIELTLHGHGLIRISPANRFLGPNPIGQALQEHRNVNFGPPRIRAVDTLYTDLQAGRDGFSKTNVNDSFQIQHAADLYEPLYRVFHPERDDRGAPMDRAVASFRSEVRQAILDRMGVSLLVTDRDMPGSPWPVVSTGSSQSRPFFILDNATAMPRAYVVPRAEIAPDDASTIAHFRTVDSHQAVLMTGDPLGKLSGPRQPFTPAEWTSDDPDRLILRVRTEAPGLLVIADTWMPGWSARVNGHPAPILKGNRAQRVIPLPESGRHEITLTYQPPGLFAGLAITLGSGLIAFGMITGGNLRRLSLTRPASTR